MNNHEEILAGGYGSGGGVLTRVKLDQDLDGDGMADDWEEIHGLNKNDPSDSAADYDGDGINNLGEYVLRTDPNTENATTSSGSPIDVRPGIDTDGDGIPNAWEWLHGLDFENPSDASKDYDRDGLTNLQEYRLNTDPNGAPAYRMQQMEPLTGTNYVYWNQIRLADNDTVSLRDEARLWQWQPQSQDTNAHVIQGAPYPSSNVYWIGFSSAGSAAAWKGNPASLFFWPSPTSNPITITGTDTRLISNCWLSPNGIWLAGWRTVDSTGQTQPFAWKMPAPGQSTSPVALSLPPNTTLPFNTRLHVNDFGFVVATGLNGSSANRGIMWSPASGGGHNSLLLSNLSGGSYSQVVGLSNSIDPIAAGNGNRSGGMARAITWSSSGSATDLGALATGNSTAFAISADGSVAGTSPALVGGSLVNQVFLATRSSSGTYTMHPQGAPDDTITVSSVNSHGEILGSKDHDKAYVWRNGVEFPLAEAISVPANCLISSIDEMNQNGALLASGWRGGAPAHFVFTNDPDADGDGLSDAYENTNKLNAYSAGDSALDFDSDGLSNIEEFRYGTNPRKADSDGDGMPDKWEIDQGFNPNDPSDANRDPDQDGVTNLREYQIGTPPTGLYEIEYRPTLDGNIAQVSEDGAILVQSPTGYWGTSSRDEEGSGGYYSDYELLNPNSNEWVFLLGNTVSWTADANGIGTFDTFESYYYGISNGVATGVFPATSYTLPDMQGTDVSMMVTLNAAEEPAQWQNWSYWGDIEIDAGLNPGTLAPWPWGRSPDGSKWLFSDYDMLDWWLLDGAGQVIATEALPEFTSWTTVTPAGHVIANAGGNMYFWDGNSAVTRQLPEGWNTDFVLPGEKSTNDDKMVLWKFVSVGSLGSFPSYGLYNCKDNTIVPITPPAAGYVSVASIARTGNLAGAVEDKSWLVLDGCHIWLNRLNVMGSGISAGTKVSDLGWVSAWVVNLADNGLITLDVVKEDNERAFVQMRPKIDTDDDGVPDDWERSVIKQLQDSGITVSTDIALFNSNDDHDGDGQSLIDEWRRGTSDGSGANFTLKVGKGKPGDRDDDKIYDNDDADPDDSVIDWKKGREPMFVVKPIEDTDGTESFLDIDISGNVLFFSPTGSRLLMNSCITGSNFQISSASTSPSWSVGIRNYHFTGGWSQFYGSSISRDMSWDEIGYDYLGNPYLSAWDQSYGTYNPSGSWAYDKFLTADAEYVDGELMRIGIHGAFNENVYDGFRWDSGVLSDYVIYGGLFSNLSYCGNVVAMDNWGMLRFWEWQHPGYGPEISLGAYPAGGELKFYSSRILQNPGEDNEVVRYIVPTMDGLFVGKPGGEFSVADVWKGLDFTVCRGVTPDGWMCGHDFNEGPVMWVNGRWKPLDDYILNKKQFTVLEVLHLEENGMAVARVQPLGAQGPCLARLLPIDVDADTDTKNHQTLDPANPPYMREVRMSGLQKSDVKPQQEAEIDIPGEETSVDAWSRHLRHDNSLAYVDVPASNLDLAVKINIDNQPLDIPSFDTITDSPPITLPTVSRAIEEAAILKAGSFGLGWSTNLDAKIICRPVYKHGTPRDLDEMTEGDFPISRYDVEVCDENGSSYEFTSTDLQSFYVKPKGAADFSQYKASLSLGENGTLLLQKKFGTTTRYKWVGGTPSGIGTYHNSYTLGHWFLPKPYTAAIISVEDLQGNKVNFTGFDTKAAQRTISVQGRSALSLTLQYSKASGSGAAYPFDLVTTITNSRGYKVSIEYDWIDCAGAQLPVIAKVLQPDGSATQYAYNSRMESGTGFNTLGSDIWKIGTGAAAPNASNTLAAIQKAFARTEEVENDDLPQLTNFFHVNLSAVRTPGGKVTTFDWEEDVRYDTTVYWQNNKLEVNPSYSQDFKSYLSLYANKAKKFQAQRTWAKIDRQEIARGAFKLGQGVFVAKSRGVADIVKSVNVSGGQGSSATISMHITQSRTEPETGIVWPDPDDFDTEPRTPESFSDFTLGSPDLPGTPQWNPSANSEVTTVVTDAKGRTTSYRFKDFQQLHLPVEQIQQNLPPMLQQELSNELNANEGMGYGTLEVELPLLGAGEASHKVTYHFDPQANYALSESIDLNGNSTLYEHTDQIANGNARYKNLKPTYGKSGNSDSQVFLRFEDPTAEIKKDASGTVVSRKEYAYDANTRMKTSIVDARGNETGFQIDSKGRTTEERFYQGKGSGAVLVSKRTYSYGNSSLPGFVTEERVIKLGTANDPSWATDLVTSHTPDGDGQVWKTIVNPGGLALATETTYDHGGNILSKTDPRGNMTSFVYDKVGRLTDVTNPDDTSRHLAYDRDGWKVRETDENGNSTLWKYDAFGRVLKTGRDLNGNGRLDNGDPAVETTYNELGLPLTVKDARGAHSTNLYDAWNRLVSTTNAKGGEITFQYDGENSGTGLANNPKWLPTTVIDTRGFRSITKYDALYRPYEVRKEYEDDLFAKSQTDYDENGNAIENRVYRTEASSPLRTATEYDVLNRPVLVTKGVGTSLAFSNRNKFTSTGLAVETVAFEGLGLARHSVTEYDAAGRSIKVTGPDPSNGTISSNSAVVETHYDAASNVDYTIDALGNRTDFEYDVRNRKTKVMAPAAVDASASGTPSVRATILTSYDEAGNVERVTDPYGTVTYTEYDRASRAVRVTAAEGQTEEAVTETAYDLNGNIVSVRDANGNYTRNVYDQLNRLVTTAVNPATGNPSVSGTGSADITVANIYDAGGNLIKVGDGEAVKSWDAEAMEWTLDGSYGHVTGFAYDGLNRKTVTSWDLGSSVQNDDVSEYDALVPISKTDPKNQTTGFSYDSLGRLTSVIPVGRNSDERSYRYAGGSSGASGPGALTAVTLPNASSGFTGMSVSSTLRDASSSLDFLDRVVSETSADTTHAYQFDKAGNRVLVTYGGTGRKLVSKYDSNNRLRRVIETLAAVSDPLTYTAQSGDRTTDYHYDKLGRVVRVDLPNGTHQQKTYDKRGRVLTSETIDGSNNFLSGFNYIGGYDAVGNVVMFNEGGVSIPSRTTVNGYDLTYRLTAEFSQTDTAAKTTNYTYDRACNRTSKTSDDGTSTISQAFIYGSPATSTNTNQLILIGANGVTTPTTTTGYSLKFTYDANGNRQTRESWGNVDTYSYDYDNRLVSLVKNTAGGSGTYKYAYDYRTRRVLRSEPTDLTVSSFSGGLSVMEFDPVATAASPDVETIRGSDWGGGVGGVLYSLRGGSLKVNSYNSRGDVVAQVDGYGSVDWQASYESFGTRIAESGSNSDRQRANTKDEDPSGLLNEGMRYRDLESGEFITRDPAGFVDGPNVYAYVRQNPWTAFDPDGLFLESPSFTDISKLATRAAEGLRTSVSPAPSPTPAATPQIGTSSAAAAATTFGAISYSAQVNNGARASGRNYANAAKNLGYITTEQYKSIVEKINTTELPLVGMYQDGAKHQYESVQKMVRDEIAASIKKNDADPRVQLQAQVSTFDKMSEAEKEKVKDKNQAVYRVGGNDASNFELRPQDLKGPKWGLSVIVGGTPQQAADKMTETYSRFPSDKASITAASTIKIIEAAGFHVIPSKSILDTPYSFHAVIQHSSGPEGNKANVELLRNLFINVPTPQGD